MIETAVLVAIVLAIIAVLCLAAAAIIAAYQDGSLRADVKFAKRYLAIRFAPVKTFLKNY